MYKVCVFNYIKKVYSMCILEHHLYLKKSFKRFLKDKIYCQIMLNAIAVMLLTAAHRAYANDKVESTDTSTNDFEGVVDTFVYDFYFLDNGSKTLSIPSD